MKIRTMCGYVDGSNIWIPSFDRNILFKGNITDGRCEMACNPGEVDVFSDVRKIYKYQNALFFFSPYKCEAGIYNTENSTLEMWGFYEKKYTQISEVLFEDNLCWIIPASFKYPVLGLNLQTREIREYETRLDNTNFTRGFVFDGCIYIANRSMNRPVISIMDIRQNRFRNCNIDRLKRIECFYVDKDYLWVLGVREDNYFRLIKMDKESDKILTAYECSFSFINSGNELNYLKMFKRRDSFFILSQGEQPNRIINLIEKKEEIVANTSGDENNSIVFETQTVGDKIYIFIRNRNIMRAFDFNSGICTDINLFADRNQLQKMKNTKIHYEGEYDLLEDFLEII